MSAPPTYRSKGRSWVKLWVGEWLDGTTRYEMTGAQRAFWIDLLTMAGRSRVPGVICANSENSVFFGYPLSRYEGVLGDTSVNVLETLRLFESQGKIELLVTRQEEPILYAVRITSWERYQSEYMRQRKTRKGARKVTTIVTTENTGRCAIEGEVEGEVEVEGEREHLARALFEKFWIEYPKKLDKGLAFREWLGLSPIDWDCAAESVPLWAKSEEWSEPKFIPSPVNFLKKRRWESRPVTKPQENLAAKAKELEARFESRGR